MCGIVGYIGNKKALPVVLSGLERLEYRGYDSFGFCVLGKDKHIYKEAGKISKAEEVRDFDWEGTIGIAHTRWATTGEVTRENAHPHCDCQEEIFIVHNGIIENYKQLKEKLIAEGHVFKSETDTEVLAHLIEKYFKDNLEEAVAKALKEVRGTYGLAVVSIKDPDKIVAARLSSPLIIGVSNGNEFLVASDPSAVVTTTKQIIVLEDNEIAVLKRDGLTILKEEKERKRISNN